MLKIFQKKILELLSKIENLIIRLIEVKGQKMMCWYDRQVF